MKRLPLFRCDSPSVRVNNLDRPASEDIQLFLVLDVVHNEVEAPVTWRKLLVKSSLLWVEELPVASKVSSLYLGKVNLCAPMTWRRGLK